MLVGLLLAEGDGSLASWSFTAHGTDVLADAPARLAEKVRSAAVVVCVSDFGRSQLMRLVDEQHWPKLRLIRCGLGGDWSGDVVRTAAANVQLLSVGRLEREKGHSLLVEAMGRLATCPPRVEAELVGDGSLRDRLVRRVAELGISDRVHFAGSVGQDSIRSHYHRADIFCLPSLGEGIPVVLMEAMATGLPVVAPRIMGIPELVEDGVSGLLVAPGRPEELATAIEKLASDPALRARLGEAGRRKVRTDYDIERSADLLVDTFSELPATRATGGGP